MQNQQSSLKKSIKKNDLRYLNTNQTHKVTPSDINVKRTYINMKQAEAQVNARWRFIGGKQYASSVIQFYVRKRKSLGLADHFVKYITDAY